MAQRIGFLKTVQYENEGRKKGPIFEAGDVYDCVEDFADRWVSRNVAVTLEGGAKTLPDGKRWVFVEKHDWDGPGGRVVQDDMDPDKGAVIVPLEPEDDDDPDYAAMSTAMSSAASGPASTVQSSAASTAISSALSTSLSKGPSTTLSSAAR